MWFYIEIYVIFMVELHEWDSSEEYEFEILVVMRWLTYDIQI